ncbi:hypothetical protein FDJ25_gp188 [Vibrio phage Aphrodite1]|uniref:Uncharacterized protein n=3 Tax=Aphroditevirus TaxID=2560092 RepID=A0A2I7QHY1_9CAUD|nr:hypothetical protein FDJ25_gp188 [Vibrio phage Aphrodite1]YP_009847738.1 hypothetical protein HWC35_gp002 [Vibrio phage USC-1]AUR81004.1 hypothetical protein Aphrodite1_0011 [Vibrio phage Aphrodite1]QCW23120.1 hypothetical protein [Vibrio phage 5 TSL-2019]QDH47396.1 hypothetical protein [Vibrio phage USC-1]
MNKFNIEVNKQIHHLDETITIHPSWRDLGKLENRHELHAELYINDEVLASGYNIDDVSYSLVEGLLPKVTDYRTKLVIYRNQEVIAESHEAWMRVDTRLSAEISDMNLKTRGMDFFATFMRALALMEPRLNKATEHPSERYKLFAWEIGPWFFELYWDVARKSYDLTYCPANDIDNITAIELESGGYTSIGAGLLPLLDSNVKEWVIHPNFRKAVIEEPLGSDLVYHYTFLMALASSNDTLSNVPAGIRAITGFARKVK